MTRQQEGDEAANRCEHGVWSADRCYTCSPHEGNNALPTPEETTLPALDVTDEDTNHVFPDFNGYRLHARFVANGVDLACRERQLIAALRERDALKSEVRTLKLAYGLVLNLHGCGGENCTEEAYLKDAEEMFAKLDSLRAQADAVVGQETPQDAFRRGQLVMNKKCADRMRTGVFISPSRTIANIDLAPYMPPLKAALDDKHGEFASLNFGGQ